MALVGMRPKRQAFRRSISEIDRDKGKRGGPSKSEVGTELGKCLDKVQATCWRRVLKITTFRDCGMTEPPPPGFSAVPSSQVSFRRLRWRTIIQRVAKFEGMYVIGVYTMAGYIYIYMYSVALAAMDRVIGLAAVRRFL